MKGDWSPRRCLSGNRNFEGRVSPNTLANYLASPPLVVAYALAGTVDINLESDPIGIGAQGEPVYLREVWPSAQEIQDTIYASLKPEMYKDNYAGVFEGNETWNNIPGADSLIYTWEQKSTYIQEPPYFSNMGLKPMPRTAIKSARVLGYAWRFDHHRPYLPCWLYHGEIARRTIPGPERCAGRRVQLLRLAAWK